MSDARADDTDLRMNSGAARVWQAVYDPASMTRGWHPADVEWALGEAHRSLRHLGSRIGPGSVKGFWPPIVKEAGDFCEASRSRRYTASEVSTMNAALDWAWAHLREHEEERRSLLLWSYCKEFGVPYLKLMREMGRTRTTEIYRFQRATFRIAAALCRADVRIPYEVLVARLERAGSDMRDDRDALAVEAQAGIAFDVPPAEPAMPEIGDLWSACADVQEAADRDSEVLGLILTRVRAETAAEAIHDTIEATNERLAKLTTEANRRGLLSTRARGLALRELAALSPTPKEAQ